MTSQKVTIPANRKLTIPTNRKLTIPFEWTPLNLGSQLVAWYDADDASTITKDGSDNVSQWDDKSGNGHHLTEGTTANQPVWIANKNNGRDYIQFQENKGQLETSLITQLDNEERVSFFYVVINPLTNGGEDRYYLSCEWTAVPVGGRRWAAGQSTGGDGPDDTHFINVFGAGEVFRRITGLAPENGIPMSNDTNVSNTVGSVCDTSDGMTAYWQLGSDVSRTAAGTEPNYLFPSSSTHATFGICKGASLPGGNQNYRGFFGNILIVSGAVNDIDRDLIWNYLQAWRGGVEI